MAQALITINGTAGSNDDLPIGLPVLLSNQDSGGEFFYFWEILDQPPGPVDSIIPNNIRDTSFTPNKEGSYLIQLTVNNNTDITNRAVAAVRFLKTRERAPAAQEQTEVDTAKGWADATNSWFSSLNNSVADPGIVIGVAGEPFAAGNIVRISPISGFSTLKSGLPGEEIVPQFALASGDDFYTAPLFLFIGTNTGATTAISGDVIRARLWGLFTTTLPFSAAIGDAVYVSPDGDFRGDFTTTDAPRCVGYVVGEVFLGVYAVYFNGLMPSSAALDLLLTNPGSVGLSPSNAIRLINDSNVLKASVNGSAYAPIAGGGTSEFDLGVYFLGQPDANEVILRYTFNQSVDFDANFLGSHGTAEDVATVIDAEFNIIKDDGVSETVVGTLNYGPGDANASFNAGSPVSFLAGESLKIVGPFSINPTLSGISINLKGTRV